MTTYYSFLDDNEILKNYDKMINKNWQKNFYIGKSTPASRGNQKVLTIPILY